MNNELFERLLHEEEHSTPDFKKEQYRFARATDHEKSELLKDILGFANAWRGSEAYILQPCPKMSRRRLLECESCTIDGLYENRLACNLASSSRGDGQ